MNSRKGFPFHYPYTSLITAAQLTALEDWKGQCDPVVFICKLIKGLEWKKSCALGLKNPKTWLGNRDDTFH